MNVKPDPIKIGINLATRSCLACTHYSAAGSNGASFCKAGKVVFKDSGCESWDNAYRPARIRVPS